MWRAVAAQHELSPAQRALLTEVCRSKDRLDRLDAVHRGDQRGFHTLELGDDQEPAAIFVLTVAAPDRLANSTATHMKRLLAEMRIPDANGRRPGRRPPRGAYVPGGRSTIQGKR